MFFDFLKDAGNYEQRKIGKVRINGLEVSTAYTSDMGYETAIIDANGVHPVERYNTKNKAEEGHKKWIDKANSLQSIIELGWGKLTDNKKIPVQRVKDTEQ